MSEHSASAIVTAISKIMADVGSVAKTGTNSFHNYKYTTAADILHKLQPLMAREGLVVFQTERAREMMMDGAVLSVTYEFSLAHKDGEVWPSPVVRTGMTSAKNSKGGFDDKALNKCHTSARKYFHLTLFEIPTGDYDDADADEDKPHGSNGRDAKPTKRVSSAQRGRDGEWDRLEADLLDCKSAADVAKLEQQYQEREYRQWSEAWRYKAEERFAQRMVEFSAAPALLEETLRESAESTATPHEPETKAAYVQQSHDAIENMRGNGDALRTWWKNETHARTRFRLSQAEIEDLKQRCAEATRAERNLTFAG